MGWIRRLNADDIDPDRLTLRTRASKRLAAYQQSNRTTTALQRWAAESVLSPISWRSENIETELAETAAVSLDSFQ